MIGPAAFVVSTMEKEKGNRRGERGGRRAKVGGERRRRTAVTGEFQSTSMPEEPTKNEDRAGGGSSTAPRLLSPIPISPVKGVVATEDDANDDGGDKVGEDANQISLETAGRFQVGRSSSLSFRSSAMLRSRSRRKKKEGLGLANIEGGVKQTRETNNSL